MVAHSVARQLGARWTPAAFTGRDAAGLSLLLAGLSALRGVDYLTHSTPPAHYTLAEVAVPWPWMGVLCLVGAALVVGGSIVHRHFSVFMGHATLFVMNLTLLLGALWATMLSPGHTDGLSRVAMLVLPLVGHGLTMLRMGPIPLAEGHGIAAESIVISGQFGR